MAVAIHDPNLVSYLADIFDRSWERAREYNERGSASEQRHRRRGATADRADAHRGPQRPRQRQARGVSTRTYASYVAALKDEYGVETRFQLGYAMGSRDVRNRARDPTTNDRLQRQWRCPRS